MRRAETFPELTHVLFSIYGLDTRHILACLLAILSGWFKISAISMCVKIFFFSEYRFRFSGSFVKEKFLDAILIL